MNWGQASVSKSAPMLLSNGRGRGAVVSVGSAVATLSLLELEVELELRVEVFEGVAVVAASSSSSSSSSALGSRSTYPRFSSSPEKGDKSQSLATCGGGLVSSNTIPCASSSASCAAIEAVSSAGGTRVSGIAGGRPASVRVKVRHSAKRRNEVRGRGRYA